MTWSHIAIATGTTSAASFSPTWPAGVQAGDVVVLCAVIAPESGSQVLSITSAPGWRTTSQAGLEARFAWCIYTAAQPLPVLAITGSTTCTWRTVAMRSTVGAAWGRDWFSDGAPPTATTLTTQTPNTLLLLWGSGIGDQPANWSVDGSGVWTTLVSSSGAGGGDVNFRNACIAWQQVATPATVTGVRARLFSNRSFLLEVGEPQWAGGFFE